MSTAAPASLSPQDLRRLSSGRWIAPLLAAMASEPGSRFGALARRLEMSRSVLSATLDTVEAHGWISRNAGHGHPLRPEYLVTPAGRFAADASERIMQERERLGLQHADLGRWSLPIVAELRDQRLRFSMLARSLTPISPRALSLALDQLTGVGLVLPELVGPRPLYGLTPRGSSMAAVL